MSLEQQLQSALSQPSLWVVVLAYLAGVVSTFLPCTLAMMPFLVGYVGGYGDTESKGTILSQTLLFVLGLSLVMTVLGVLASILGLAFGSWAGAWWYDAIGILVILMGLQLLGVFYLPLPAWISQLPEGGIEKQGWARYGAPVLLGITFGLAASPCGTPFLAAILGFLSTTQNILLGGLCLFAYAFGQGTLLIVAGLGTGFLKQRAQLNHVGQVISKLSGAVFILTGLLLLLNAHGLLDKLMGPLL